MNILQRFVSDLSRNHPNVTGVVIDFSKIPVEDAIQLMVLLLSRDAKWDIKDLLNLMESTRIDKLVARGVISDQLKFGMNAIKDLGSNPAFAKAVEDINESILRNKGTEKQERAIALANQKQAQELLAATQRAEGDANDLEHPVGTNHGNKYGIKIPLILSGVFILIIIAGVLIRFRPLISQGPQTKIPAAGITTSLPDGSASLLNGSGLTVSSAITPIQTVTRTITKTPIATVIPTTSTISLSAGNQGTVKQNANCRYGPGTVFPVLSYVLKGTTVDVNGVSKDRLWLNVKPCGLGEGWVLASFIQQPFDLLTLQVLAGPPIPTLVPPTDTPVPFFSCASAYGIEVKACMADTRCLFNGKSCVNK
jgi:hypothetical protein